MPYNLAASPAVAARGDSLFSCPAPAASPARDLFFSSVYEGSDEHRATVNPEAREEYREKTQGPRKFENAIVIMANDYLRTGGTDNRISECVLDWLYTWAKGKALLGNVNAGGISFRQWMLASLSSAYAQIGAGTLNPVKRQTVEKWLSACARAVAADYPDDATQNRQKNNHLYWAAWAVTVPGIAINNPSYYRWGINKARYALMEQALDDGTLPLEMDRGGKALQYHIVALEPLILLAETGYRNGDDLYSIRDGILHRMVKRVLAGMKNDNYFEKKTGFRQLPATDLYPGYHGWMEVYYAHFPKAEIAEWLDIFRPIFFRRTGGDMTFLYRTAHAGKTGEEEHFQE